MTKSPTNSAESLGASGAAAGPNNNSKDKDGMGGLMGRWPRAGASRSFVHKRINRESLGPRFPDSERGESRARASFLIDQTLTQNRTQDHAHNHQHSTTTPSSSNVRSKFTDLERMALSPTMGEKRFSKTPRATLNNADHADPWAGEKENERAQHAEPPTEMEADVGDASPEGEAEGDRDSDAGSGSGPGSGKGREGDGSAKSGKRSLFSGVLFAKRRNRR